jgi:hypothetical protein
MNKLVVTFIVARILDQRDFIRLGIKELVDKGVMCDVINISPIVNPELENITAKNDAINEMGISVKTITSFENFKQYFKSRKLNKVISACFMPGNVHRTLKLAGATTAIQLLGPIPVITKKRSILQRIRNMTFKKIGMGILSKIYNYSETYDFIIYAGNHSLNHYLPNHLYKKAIPCHSYDFYLKQLQGSIKKNSHNHIVFIDQMLPFHSDFIIQGQKELADSDYFNRLNAFFSKLEAYTNLKVVIASHPRIVELDFDYSRLFNGRRVIVNQTSELINNSKLCLAHYSTAVSYAVMAKVPVLLLEDTILYKRHVIRNFELLKNALKCKSVNLNANVSIDGSIHNVDELAYENYKRDYITTSCDEQKTNGEIMMEYFLEVDRFDQGINVECSK